MADTLTAAQQVERLERNEKRVNTWVNTMDSYSTEAVPPREVPSIPALMEDLRGKMLVRILRGEWQPNTEYQQNNVVERPGNNFICARGHTSGQSFDADLAAGLWVVDSVVDVGPADTGTPGVGYKATAAEAAAGVTDAARGEYPAFIGPEELAVFADIHWPKAATQNEAGLIMLATPEDINEEEPDQTDNTKGVPPKLLQFWVNTKRPGQATETEAGIVYFPTATELESGEPDEGREGLSIALPLGADIGGGLTSAVLYTESTEIIAEKDGYILVWLVGGGGGGGSGYTNPGGGGGAGGVRCAWLPVTKGQSIAIKIGAGGNGGAGSGATDGAAGGATTVVTPGASVTAAGGVGGARGNGASAGVGTLGLSSTGGIHAHGRYGAYPSVCFWGTSATYGSGGAGHPGASSNYSGTPGTQGCVLIVY